MGVVLLQLELSHGGVLSDDGSFIGGIEATNGEGGFDEVLQKGAAASPKSTSAPSAADGE